MDLFVDTSRPRGISRELYDRLREAIVTGRAAAGDRLPTSRDLAGQLGISRHTVTTVYGRLAAEGYLDGRAGGGTYVSYAAAGSGAPAAPSPGLQPRHLGHSAVAEPPPPGGVDLRIGRPDPRLFPLADWRRCVVTSLQVRPDGYLPRAGDPDLQRTLARWVARSRGVEIEPAGVVVTAGAQHAIDLVARTLLRPGDTVAVENPGYAPVRNVFESLGVRVMPVPVDAEGLVVDAVPTAARLVYVTPSHQSPTGVPLSLPRRQALLELAARHDMAVVEDDYDSEFRHSDRPLEPLFRLDRTGHVVYVGTFSKTLAPSLKIGFAALPGGLAPAVAALVSDTGTQPPRSTQEALHRFVTDGYLDRHLRRARRVYAERHRIVTEFLDRARADGLVESTPVSHAGMHVTTALPRGLSAADVIGRARHAGLALSSLSDAWIDGPEAELLPIGFGAADPAELERGLSALRDALKPPYECQAHVRRVSEHVATSRT